MAETLNVTIKLGNAATSEPEDLAQLLRNVADKVEAGASAGRIFDYNGNTVGVWAYEV